MASARALKLVDAGSGAGELREFADGDSLTLAGAVDEAAAVSLASAATVNIGAALANTINITGTVAITSLGSANAGVTRRLVFGGALTLTYSATALILPTAASITTAAGDVAEFLSLGSGNWLCICYQRATGQPLVSSPEYTSSQQTWTNGGLLTLAHGITGGAPTRFSAQLVCIAADTGYSVGDVIQHPVFPDSVGTAAGRGLSLYADATNIYVRMGNSGMAPILNKGTGAPADVSISSWRLVIRASRSS